MRDAMIDRLRLAVPHELRALHSWLCWRKVPRPGSKKFDKVPMYPGGEQRNGEQGSVDDRAKLGTFDEVMADFEAGRGAGVGLAMLGEGFTGLDFDDCIDAAGVIDPKVLEVVNETYTERSPSGTGLRSFYRGELPAALADRKDPRVETFVRRGFVTITGDRVNGVDIEPLDDRVVQHLTGIFSTARNGQGRHERMKDASSRDPILARLYEREMVIKDHGGGKFAIHCPFAKSHTTTGGTGATVYFLPHTNGYSQGHFDCKHSHCSERSDAEFIEAIGGPKAESAEWPEPQPLAVKIESEPYPLDALPDAIRMAVEEVAAFVKAPLPMVASSALSALSLAIQAHVDAKRAEKLSGPVGLFLLTIAESGERKTTCDHFFLTAIRKYEQEQAELAKPELKKHAAEFAAWAAEREGILGAIRDAGRKGGAVDKLRRDLVELEHLKPKRLRIPRWLYTDATPEALAYCLANEWPSGGVVTAEGGSFFGSHGMGKDSVMRNLSLLNQLWDGISLTIDRRTTESYIVKGARLTMGLQVQAAALREFFDRSGALARGIGFLARFLLAWPESTQGSRPFTEAPANWPHLGAFNRRLGAILEQSVPIDSEGAMTPAMLTLTVEAKKAWVEFHDSIEVELRNGGELYDVRDVASKAADNAARLAALLHAFEHGSSGAIGIDAFEGASRIVAWHLNESRRFFGELALPPELADAGRLDAFLTENCRRERTNLVGKNYVRRHGPLRNGAALDTAIRELGDLDRVRLVKNGKRLTIQVNPALQQ